MKVAIRLVPIGDGQWHWSIGRGGKESTFGNADSFENAQNQAEETAKNYAQEASRATAYLFDTETGIRIPIKGGE